MEVPDDKRPGRDPDLAAEVQYRLVEKLAESERRHRELLSDLPDVVLRLDTEEKVSYLNDAWQEQFGFDPEATLGQPIEDFVASPDRPKWRSLVAAADTTLDDEIDRVVRFVDVEGAQHWMNARLRRLESGELVGSLEDVTIRRQLETELLRAQRLESIGRLAGGLAHDFNNLLTVILGNINLAQLRLKRNQLDLKELALASRACDHAANLTKQMLSFSKGGEPIRKTAHLGELVSEAIELCLRGSNAQSVVHIPRDLPPVKMDASQIHQVINNLAINAIQAMPEGGNVRVDVVKHRYQLASSDELIPGVAVEISDEGVGIPEEHREHIFEPYFTTKETGNGLGLTSAFWIVQRHGGLLELKPREGGVGTLVRVTLPIAGRDAVLEEEDSYVASVLGAQVLVMDDDDMVRGAMVAMLEASGHEVASCRDGEECVEVYERARADGRPFSLVIMDLTIAGGRDGLWTIKRLRELDPGVRAIVASGYSNAPVLSDPERYGFSGVLAKPLMLGDLDRVISEVLASSTPADQSDETSAPNVGTKRRPPRQDSNPGPAD